MATKPTGRPRGRPPKLKAPKRPRKRPPYDILKDRDRYLLAFLQAHISQTHWNNGGLSGTSEAKIAHFFAGLRFGLPIETPSNIKAMLNGERFQVGTYTRCGDEHGEKYRDQDTFYARGENLRRKLRRLRNDPNTDPNAKWLWHMSFAWCICLQGVRANESFAAFLVNDIGESEYFEQEMRPLLRDRARRREEGLVKGGVNLPEFLRILRLTT